MQNLSNISTFFSWVLLVYPLKYIEPTAVITIVLGVNPVATLLIDWVLFKKKPRNKANILVSLSILLIVTYVGYLCTTGVNVIENATQNQVFVSLLYCMIAGMATASNNLFIKKLLKKFAPTELLSFRFIFTILITGALTYFGNTNTQYNLDFIVYIMSTTLFFVIAPLLLIQLTLRELEPIRVAIISPVMPVVVATFQLIEGKSNLSIYTILGTISIWILLTFGIYFSRPK